MADTTFVKTLPPLKAVDNGDGTYSLAVCVLNPAAGTDTVFAGVIPPLKAIDNNDGTYLMSIIGV